MNSYLERMGVKVYAHLLDGELPALPVTVHWRLDCVTTGAELADWTAVTPTVELDDFGATTGVYVTVQVPGALNEIQASNNAKEVKRILVVTDKDRDNEGSAEWFYQIRRSQGRT